MPLTPPQEYRKTEYTHRRGTRAAQPAAADVLPGTLYFVTDEILLERSTGAAWESYSRTNYTLGSVLFAGTGGIPSQDNTNFFWNNTLKSLGIGNQPTRDALEIAGTTRLGKDMVATGFTQINLVGGITAVQTTIPVDSTANFPSQGWIRMEAEVVVYTSKDATNFLGCTRGRLGTTAATHADNIAVRYIVVVVSPTDTAGSSSVIAFDTFHLPGPSGLGSGFIEPGSTTTLTRLAIGRFAVSDTAAWFSDGTRHAYLGQDGTNGFVGTRSNHPFAIRTNNASRLFVTTSGILQFAGITSSEVALKRVTTTLEVRLADDSAYAELRALRNVIDAGERFGFSGRARITSPADSQILVTNNAAADFARLMFGGTSSSFPALKRSSAELQARLADDSDYANFHAKAYSVNGTAGASGTGTTITAITVENGIVTAITVS